MSANAGLIVLTMLALSLAGCHRQPAVETKDAPDTPGQAVSARDPSAGHIYLCPMDKDIRS